jgi:hypothetical protein
MDSFPEPVLLLSDEAGRHGCLFVPISDVPQWIKKQEGKHDEACEHYRKQNDDLMRKSETEIKHLLGLFSSLSLNAKKEVLGLVGDNKNQWARVVLDALKLPKA